MKIRAAALEKIYALARTPLAGKLIREVFTHMSFLLPLERLCDTPSWMAFYHPSPSYPFHVLLVSKREYKSLLDIPAQDAFFLQDLFQQVQTLVRENKLEETGYRLIVNGGQYQDVPVLHFHLVSDYQAPGKSL